MIKMRYIIVSDIHANLEALLAVTSFCDPLEPYQLYCLGDSVGYGVNPSECLQTLSEEANLEISGNFDLAVAGVISLEDHNEMAQQSIEWTKSVLGADEISSLANMPLVYIDGDYCFTHASPIEPMRFDFIRTVEDVQKVMSSIGQRFCFVGHTHLPVCIQISKKTGKWNQLKKSAIRIKDGFQYFINVGSVGQPRDSNPDACFVVLDEEAETMEFIRIPYDIQTCQAKIKAEGLPEYLAERLTLAR